MTKKLETLYGALKGAGPSKEIVVFGDAVKAQEESVDTSGREAHERRAWKAATREQAKTEVAGVDAMHDYIYIWMKQGLATCQSYAEHSCIGKFVD